MKYRNVYCRFCSKLNSAVLSFIGENINNVVKYFFIYFRVADNVADWFSMCVKQ